MSICSKAIHLQLGLPGGASNNIKDLSEIATIHQLSRIISKLSSISPSSHYLEEHLEAALVDLCLQQANNTSPTTSHSQASQQKPVSNSIASSVVSKKAIKKSSSKGRTNPPTDDAWVRILSEVKKHNNSLYALLRSAQPTLEKDSLTVLFRFQFHKRRLEESANLNLLKQAATKIMGDVSINIDVKQPRSKEDSSSDEDRQDKEAVNSVLQILGGEVVNG
jgi:hypothetical protein